MEIIDVKASKIYIGNDIDINEIVPQERKVIIITDEIVHSLYEHIFPNYPKENIITIGQGEKIKTFKTVNSIYKKLMKLGVDRDTFILGYGGGIVCDITGFVASTYMRGLDFGFVSTTLLSQVDASVGGKNGYNYDGYKNMIGTFNQPKFVICDSLFLNTLPKIEIKCGIAEIIKIACIRSYKLFKILEDLENFENNLNEIIYESIKNKAGIVELDEFESYERKLLNFGHTIGHALEKVHKLKHGIAVANGILIESKISKELENITNDEYERIVKLLKLYDLNNNITYKRLKLISALYKDKKRKDKTIHLVSLSRIGESFINPIKIQTLRKLI